VSFILESLPKSFLQFCSNAVMNKIVYTITILLNELQTYQSLMKNKGLINGEANVAYFKKFHKGSFFVTKSVLSSSGSKKIQKKKGGKGKAPIVEKNKDKAKVADMAKCFHCNVDGHWNEIVLSTMQRRRKREVNLIYLF